MAEQDDILNLLGCEMAARVAYAKEQIAEGCYTPRLPPAPWAGRDTIVAGVAQEYQLKLEQAAPIVDQACMELIGGDADSERSGKRLMLIRLTNIRQLIMQFIRSGTVEQHSRCEERVDPKTGETKLVWIPWKKKETPGFSMAAVAQLIAVEKEIAMLQGLYKQQDGGGTLYEQLTAIIEKKSADGSRTVVASLAQKQLTTDIAGLPEAGQRHLLEALREADGVKKVKSKVVRRKDKNDARPNDSGEQAGGADRG